MSKNKSNSKNKDNKKNAPEAVKTEFCEFVDEEGIVERFEILGYVEFEGINYAALLPEGDNAQVHILEVVEELDSDCDSYMGIDDQDLVDRVYEKFMEENKEHFNFID